MRPGNMLLTFAVLYVLAGAALGASIWSVFMDRIEDFALFLCITAALGGVAYLVSTQVEGEIHLRDVIKPTTFAWAGKLPDISASTVAVFTVGSIVGGVLVGLFIMARCGGRKSRLVHTP